MTRNKRSVPLEEKEYRLVSDDDGHWYVIPVELSNAFNAWEDECREYEQAYEAIPLDAPDSVYDKLHVPDESAFDEYRIDGGPEHIKFRSWKLL